MSRLILRRVTALLASGSFFLIAVVLLLADRSGSLVEMARQSVIEMGQQIESNYNIDVIDRQDIPGTADQLGHAALWGAGMLLVGWLCRRRLPVSFTALMMAGTSLAFELAQPALSTTRAFQPSDMVGNVSGIAGAAVLLAVVVRIWRPHQVSMVAAPSITHG